MGTNPTPSGTMRALGDGVANATIEDGVAIVRIAADSLREREVARVLPDLQMLCDDCDGRIVLSFSRVRAMSSACINAIIELHRRCKDAGGRLVVCELPVELREILSIVKLDRAVTIESDEARARRAASRVPLRAA
ncbi:MAG: STAS domain-containing protein [Phycisphaerales bacterium]|jgi:anti-anti-sigma factor|nr:STAS domain-containing protein [Phycisphaerales bacterium]